MMENLSKQIWIPKSKKLSWGDSKKWYNNITIELSLDFLPKNYKKIFAEYYQKAGLISNPLKYNFFHRHFSFNFSLAVNNLFTTGTYIKILDLGGGMGSQAIFFSILGVKVTVVDFDKTALEILKLRKKFYEKILDRNLDIEIICVDVFSIDYSKYGPFNTVYSLFSFNLMQPTKKLLSLIAPHLQPGAIFVIQDGNKNMWFNKVFRKRTVLGKKELCNELGNNGFHNIKTIGGYALPPIFWAFIPNKLLIWLDRILAKSELFTGSFLYIAKK